MQSWLLKPPDFGEFPRLKSETRYIRCSWLFVGREMVLAPEIER
jgi:hypothetical protein